MPLVVGEVVDPEPAAAKAIVASVVVACLHLGRVGPARRGTAGRPAARSCGRHAPRPGRGRRRGSVRISDTAWYWCVEDTSTLVGVADDAGPHQREPRRVGGHTGVLLGDLHQPAVADRVPQRTQPVEVRCGRRLREHRHAPLDQLHDQRRRHRPRHGRDHEVRLARRGTRRATGTPAPAGPAAAATPHRHSRPLQRGGQPPEVLGPPPGPDDRETGHTTDSPRTIVHRGPLGARRAPVRFVRAMTGRRPASVVPPVVGISACRGLRSYLSRW